MVGRYDNRFIIFMNDSDAFNLIGVRTGLCLHNQLVTYLQLAQFREDRIAMSGKNTVVFHPGQYALGEVPYPFLQLVRTSSLDDGQFLLQSRNRQTSNIVTLCRIYRVKGFIWCGQDEGRL